MYKSWQKPTAGVYDPNLVPRVLSYPPGENPGNDVATALLFSNSDVRYFTSHKNKSVKVLWDGTYGFSSSS